MTNEEVVNDLAEKILLYRSIPGASKIGEKMWLINLFERLRFSYVKNGVPPVIANNTVFALKLDVEKILGEELPVYGGGFIEIELTE